MGVQADLKDAIEQGREDVVRVLAEYGVVPVAVENTGGTDLLGKTRAPDFNFERRHEAESERVADRQTRVRMVDALGLRSEEDGERVREEIESHEAWQSRV
jgi:hypothetical protein